MNSPKLLHVCENRGIHAAMPPPPIEHCELCGGTMIKGKLVDKKHTLCTARAEHGQPTPSLGKLCPCCFGAMCHPRSTVGPINPSGRTMSAWAPACTCCNGKGFLSDDADVNYMMVADKPV